MNYQNKIDNLCQSANTNFTVFKNYVLALVDYHRALDLFDIGNSNNYYKIQKYDIIIRIAICYDNLGQTKKCLEFINNSNNLITNIPSILLYESILLFSENLIDKSKIIFEKFKKIISNNDTHLYNTFYVIFMYLSNYNNAKLLNCVNSFLLINPKNVVLMYVKAMVYHRIAYDSKKSNTDVINSIKSTYSNNVLKLEKEVINKNKLNENYNINDNITINCYKFKTFKESSHIHNTINYIDDCYNYNKEISLEEINEDGLLYTRYIKDTMEIDEINAKFLIKEGINKNNLTKILFIISPEINNYEPKILKHYSCLKHFKILITLFKSIQMFKFKLFLNTIINYINQIIVNKDTSKYSRLFKHLFLRINNNKKYFICTFFKYTSNDCKLTVLKEGIKTIFMLANSNNFKYLSKNKFKNIEYIIDYFNIYIKDINKIYMQYKATHINTNILQNNVLYSYILPDKCKSKNNLTYSNFFNKMNTTFSLNDLFSNKKAFPINLKNKCNIKDFKNIINITKNKSDVCFSETNNTNNTNNTNTFSNINISSSYNNYIKFNNKELKSNKISDLRSNENSFYNLSNTNCCEKLNRLSKDININSKNDNSNNNLNSNKISCNNMSNSIMHNPYKSFTNYTNINEIINDLNKVKDKFFLNKQNNKKFKIYNKECNNLSKIKINYIKNKLAKNIYNKIKIKNICFKSTANYTNLTNRKSKIINKKFDKKDKNSDTKDKIQKLDKIKYKFNVKNLNVHNKYMSNQDNPLNNIKFNINNFLKKQKCTNNKINFNLSGNIITKGTYSIESSLRKFNCNKKIVMFNKRPVSSNIKEINFLKFSDKLKVNQCKKNIKLKINSKFNLSNKRSLTVSTPKNNKINMIKLDKYKLKFNSVKYKYKLKVHDKITIKKISLDTC